MKNKYQEYQEALTILKTHIVDYDEELEEESYLYSSYKEEFDTLQELVDKEKPKKVAYDCLPHPTMDSGQNFDYWWCPNCEVNLNKEDKYNYCPECGQALDWSEENEQ